MSRGPDAATQLERALLESARLAGCRLVLDLSEMTRWASATFTGARHLISLSGEDRAAIDGWLATLAEAEFVLRDHLVADLTVEWVRRADGVTTIGLEILTVEER